MADVIKTRRMQSLRCENGGNVLIEHTFVDRPASLETWIEICGALSKEYDLTWEQAHLALGDTLDAWVDP